MFKMDNIRYTGIGFIMIPGNSDPGKGVMLAGWEGNWPGASAYATWSSGTIDWFDVTVTKIDSTHVKLKSLTLNKESTVELSWLPDYTKLSCGAAHNTHSSLYGPSRMRNVRVAQF